MKEKHNCIEHQSCLDSRPRKEGRTRRYKCQVCGDRWSTMEVRVGEVNADNRGQRLINIFMNEISRKQRKELLLDLMSRVLNDDNEDKILGA